MENQIADRPGLWAVWGVSWPLAYRWGLIAALRAAFEASAACESVFDLRAPSRLELVGTAERMDAREIMRWWRELGWLS
jgi:hypothetical protein